MIGKTVTLKSGKQGTVVEGQNSLGKYKVQYIAGKNKHGYPNYKSVWVRAENLVTAK
jgi:hypothetical protein